MDNTGFFISVNGRDRSIESRTGAVNVQAAIVLGDPSGTKPPVDATWRGLMVGTYMAGRQSNGGKFSGNILQGDAELVFDAEESTLNAAFFNIRNLGKLDKLPDPVRGLPEDRIVFWDVPVDRAGSYSRFTTEEDRALGARYGGSFIGAFYGAGHAETAGTFGRFGINAAFGAKRVTD